MYSANFLCDSVLKYVNQTKHSMRADVEYAFRDYNIIPTLIQLNSEDLILYRPGYCNITPKGQNVIEQFGSYSAFKNSNTIAFECKEFKKELQDLLIENWEQEIDVLILVDKFCLRRGKDESSSIKAEMGAEVERLYKMGHIQLIEQDLFDLKYSTLGTRQDSFLVKSTDKFIEYYKRQGINLKNNSPKQKRRIPIPYRVKAVLQKQTKSLCPFCSNNDVDHFQIHHIDENPENNEIENLLMVCPTCHSKITKGDISVDIVIVKKIEISSN